MGKNIVFCADGTWNGPGQSDSQGNLDPTNVFKLFVRLPGDANAATLMLADEQETEFIDPTTGNATQVAKYINGVGDSDNPIYKLLGGATGSGLISRIVRGYTYISRNYEQGDLIFLVGFSRGAYTVRALAGLILSSGLLNPKTYDPADNIQAYRLGAAAWYTHQQTLVNKRSAPAGDSPLGELKVAFDKLTLDLPGFLTRPPPTGSFISPVPIKAIGVWDTVGSYGFIPIYADSGARLDMFPLADTILGENVAYGFHAISLDEQRADFTPTLWDQRTDVVQSLFPGAHADVGGGYPIETGESGLSDATLEWMIKQLTDDTVGMIVGPVGKFSEKPNPAAPSHQPWLYLPFRSLPTAPRNFTGRTDLIADASINDRRKAGVVVTDPGSTGGLPPQKPVRAAYSPNNLPLTSMAGLPVDL